MRTGGVATVSMLVMLTVGTAIGALVGLFLGHTFHHAIVAIIAGMAGTFVAVIAQNALVHRQIGVGTDEEPIPMVIMVCGLIAAVARAWEVLSSRFYFTSHFPCGLVRWQDSCRPW